jgi:hypothetical protein
MATESGRAPSSKNNLIVGVHFIPIYCSVIFPFLTDMTVLRILLIGSCAFKKPFRRVHLAPSRPAQDLSPVGHAWLAATLARIKATAQQVQGLWKLLQGITAQRVPPTGAQLQGQTAQLGISARVGFRTSRCVLSALNGTVHLNQRQRKALCVQLDFIASVCAGGTVSAVEGATSISTCIDCTQGNHGEKENGREKGQGTRSRGIGQRGTTFQAHTPCFLSLTQSLTLSGAAEAAAAAVAGPDEPGTTQTPTKKKPSPPASPTLTSSTSLHTPCSTPSNTRLIDDKSYYGRKNSQRTPVIL